MGRSSRERKKDSKSERSRKDDRIPKQGSTGSMSPTDDVSYQSRTRKRDKYENERDEDRSRERSRRDLSNNNDDQRHRNHRESKRNRRERDDHDDDDDYDYDRHQKHRSSSSRHRRYDSDDSGNGNTKKRKRDHDNKRRDKKKSSKHKKSKKHSKRDDEGESIDDRTTNNSQLASTKRMTVDKINLYPLGDILGHKPDRVLDPELDYFEFHQHFWLYLYREQQVAFNDVTTEQSRKLFKDFTKQYNEGKLESAYYDSKGPPHEALNEIKTTGHKWGFQISDRESKNLQTIQQGIQKLTDYSTGQPITEPNKAMHKDSTTTLQTKEEEMQQKVDSKRAGSYQQQKKHLQIIDELTGGRSDGRERLIEKRKEIGVKTHGAARDREESASVPILSDDVIYGGSGTDFESALAAQKRRKMQQEEQKQQRLSELQAKEEEKKKAMLQLLGLSDKIKPGEKIKIKPRQDP